MKPAAIMGMLFLLLCGTASAQLTLLPQLGFDRANTKISYNDITSFSFSEGIVNGEWSIGSKFPH